MPRTSRARSPESRVANAVLKQNLSVRPGERVVIEAWSHTVPWAGAFAREARRLGAHPLVFLNDEGGFWDSFDHGETKTLGTMAKHERAAIKKTDVFVHLQGPGDRIRLDGVPEKKGEEAFADNEDWYKIARKVGLRGVRMEIARPFPSLAKLYGVTESEWRRVLEEATLVSPSELRRTGKQVARRLRNGRVLRLTHPNGTDLTLRLAGRKPVVFDGIPDPSGKRGPYGMLVNVPAGSVRVALEERHAEGRLVGNRTSYYDAGTADGVKFTFKRGRLVRREFAHGADQFEKPFASAGRGKDRPGIFSLGLNSALRNTPQLEDVERGAAMVSVGGNSFLGGKNTARFFGFGVVGGGNLELDGHPLVEKGELV